MQQPHGDDKWQIRGSESSEQSSGLETAPENVQAEVIFKAMF